MALSWSDDSRNSLIASSSHRLARVTLTLWNARSWTAAGRAAGPNQPSLTRRSKNLAATNAPYPPLGEIRSDSTARRRGCTGFCTCCTSVPEDVLQGASAYTRSDCARTASRGWVDLTNSEVQVHSRQFLPRQVGVDGSPHVRPDGVD